MDHQHSQQDIFWLSTIFQNVLQVSLQMSKAPAPQQTPYIHKYQAINHLKSLLQPEHPYKFIPYCLLGEIYADVEQTNDSIKAYQSALDQLAKLPSKYIHKFLNYHMIVYNMLGLSYINRDDNDEGLGCLAKAYDLYQSFCQAKSENVYSNRCYQSKGRQFRPYYQGGVDHDQMEDSFTLTLFYLAQAYTKIGFKDKAAQYCGKTLQRQYRTSKYQINQFCHNLIGLSDYYQGNNFYAQAQYLLTLAVKVLPEGKKKKMRATLQIALGNMLGNMLKYSCNRIANKDIPSADDNAIISRQLLIFESFDQKFPFLQLPTDLQGCKNLFRMANTQFKKALEIYVLDGFVTQHIDILFAQSNIYKYLARVQPSRERLFSMIDKRRELLQPLLKELNNKAYPGTCQKILVEVSEIYNQLFTIKSVIVTDIKEGKSPSEEKLKSMNQIGLKFIFYNKEIVSILLEDKDAQKNQQYHRSIINAKFNMAKTYSKLLSNDKKTRVQFLKQSLSKYQEVLQYINTKAQPRSAFDKEHQMTQDVIIMMPNRIDRINYGQASPIQ